MSDNADYVRRMIAEGHDDFHFTRVARLLDERDALAAKNEKLCEALQLLLLLEAKLDDDDPQLIIARDFARRVLAVSKEPAP